MAGLNIIAICWIIYLVYWGISAIFAKKSATKRNWKVRILFILLIIVIAIFSGSQAKTNPNLFNYALFNGTQSLFVLGSILTVLGLIGAVWARTYLGRNWSGYVTYKKDHELVTSGPYRFIRHPIYTSILLMVIGTFIYSGYVFVLEMFLILAIIFLVRVKREEEIMTKLFGKKYKDYMKRTKALVPFVV